MNTLYISLLLVGLITISAAFPADHKCTNLPAKHNFQPEQFFDGTWYTTHLYDGDEPKSAGDGPEVCVQSKSNVFQNNIVREIYSTYLPKLNTTFYVENYINLLELKGVGKYMGEGRAMDVNGKLIGDFIAGVYTVLDTDYENYAVMYQCSSPTPMKTYSAFAIQSRHQDAAHVHPNVETMLKRLGLSLDQFTKMDCPNVHP